jgi:hypothetical protein
MARHGCDTNPVLRKGKCTCNLTLFNKSFMKPSLEWPGWDTWWTAGTPYTVSAMLCSI